MYLSPSYILQYLADEIHQAWHRRKPPFLQSLPHFLEIRGIDRKGGSITLSCTPEHFDSYQNATSNFPSAREDPPATRARSELFWPTRHPFRHIPIYAYTYSLALYRELTETSQWGPCVLSLVRSHKCLIEIISAFRQGNHPDETTRSHLEPARERSSPNSLIGIEAVS